MRLITKIRHIHIAKAFTWRVVASLTTFLISWMVTGDIVIGGIIGLIEAATKIVLYYGHERAWFYFQRHRHITS